MSQEFDQLLYRLQSPCGIGAPSDHDTMAEASGVIQNMRAALQLVDAFYSHAWDRVDGGLAMFGTSVQKFEDAREAVRKALGINLLSADTE